MASWIERLVVVTGAGSGIGRAAAGLFAAHGARVLLVGRRADALEETARRCRAAGGIGLALSLDVTAPDAGGRLAQAVGKAGGTLHALVQSAGAAVSASVEETTDDAWNGLLAVNLSAPFRLLRALVPALRRAGGASVVNVASTLALGGLPRSAAYCASKGGLVQFTRAAALDLAGAGIRVNAVCPGVVDTPMLYRDRGDGLDAASRARALAAIHPLGRVGRPEEVAALIFHLCSEESRFVTGVAWPIDGGLTAGWWGGPGEKP